MVLGKDTGVLDLCVMAKQVGDIIIEGTIDDITFYKMEGKGYARMKTSLTGKRVKKDPKFKRTMQSAHRLGRGSQLAAKVYRSLPREEQKYALYMELKTMAVLALKEGKSEAVVMEFLQQHLRKAVVPKQSKAAIVLGAVLGNTSSVHKLPKLFKVYGGRLKEIRSQVTKKSRKKTTLALYN